MQEHQSILNARNLHYHFPLEVKEFLNYTRLYIKHEHFVMQQDYKSQKKSVKSMIKIASGIFDRIERYQALLDDNSSFFSYMLFQPSTRIFMEDCLLQYILHSDCSPPFKDFIRSVYN